LTSGGFDKVELRVPHNTRFTHSFAEKYQYARNETNTFRASQYYGAAGDLRELGHQVRLHLHCMMDKEGNHKVELMETGTMGYSRMAHEVAEIFEMPERGIKALPVTRVDLCADAAGVPVSWFIRHARGKFKRWSSELGEYSAMGFRGPETLYLGRRPNVIRCYDKVAERKHAYAKFCRRVSADAELPSFEDTYGIPETGFTLTRVERQIGGGRVPAQLNNLARLKNAPDFDPFENLILESSGSIAPEKGDHDFVQHWAGLYLRTRAEELGQHGFHRWLSGEVGSNLSKYKQRFARYLPFDQAPITREELRDIYATAVTRQLAA
jgi:hypothetical protein